MNITAFRNLPDICRDLVISLFVILNLGQGYHLLKFLWRRKYLEAVIMGTVSALYFSLFYALLLSNLGQNMPKLAGVQVSELPVILIFLTIMIAFAHLGYLSFVDNVHGQNELSMSSVKQSFDHLPEGVCFFDRAGMVVLCNEVMHKLSVVLLGNEMWQIEELFGALEKPANGVHKIVEQNRTLYQFADGSVWKFEAKDVGAAGYVQVVATNLTELHALKKELVEGNEKIQKSIAQVERITENVAEITRQQELLAAKMLVHNKMGNCMLAVRHYCRDQDYELSETRKQERNDLIALWRESLESLRNEAFGEDETDAAEEVIRIAKTIGVDVQIHGQMPADKEKAYLLVVALRECITNARNHAGGTRVDLTITEEITGKITEEITGTITERENHIVAEFTNNGSIPTETIVEGGGLSSLRRRVEEAGAEMIVESQPVFVLRIIFPKMEG